MKEKIMRKCLALILVFALFLSSYVASVHAPAVTFTINPTSATAGVLTKFAITPKPTGVTALSVKVTLPEFAYCGVIIDTTAYKLVNEFLVGGVPVPMPPNDPAATVYHYKVDAELPMGQRAAPFVLPKYNILVVDTDTNGDVDYDAIYLDFNKDGDWLDVITVPSEGPYYVGQWFVDPNSIGFDGTMGGYAYGVSFIDQWGESVAIISQGSAFPYELPDDQNRLQIDFGDVKPVSNNMTFYAVIERTGTQYFIVNYVMNGLAQSPITLSVSVKPSTVVGLANLNQWLGLPEQPMVLGPEALRDRPRFNLTDLANVDLESKKVWVNETVKEAAAKPMDEVYKSGLSPAWIPPDLKFWLKAHSTVNVPSDGGAAYGLYLTNFADMYADNPIMSMTLSPVFKPIPDGWWGAGWKVAEGELSAIKLFDRWGYGVPLSKSGYYYYGEYHPPWDPFWVIPFFLIDSSTAGVYDTMVFDLNGNRIFGEGWLTMERWGPNLQYYFMMSEGPLRKGDMFERWSSENGAEIAEIYDICQPGKPFPTAFDPWNWWAGMYWPGFIDSWLNAYDMGRYTPPYQIIQPLGPSVVPTYAQPRFEINRVGTTYTLVADYQGQSIDPYCTWMIGFNAWGQKPIGTFSLPTSLKVDYNAITTSPPISLSAKVQKPVIVFDGVVPTPIKTASGTLTIYSMKVRNAGNMPAVVDLATQVSRNMWGGSNYFEEALLTISTLTTTTSRPPGNAVPNPVRVGGIDTWHVGKLVVGSVAYDIVVGSLSEPFGASYDCIAVDLNRDGIYSNYFDPLVTYDRIEGIWIPSWVIWDPIAGFVGRVISIDPGGDHVVIAPTMLEVMLPDWYAVEHYFFLKTGQSITLPVYIVAGDRASVYRFSVYCDAWNYRISWPRCDYWWDGTSGGWWDFWREYNAQSVKTYDVTVTSGLGLSMYPLYAQSDQCPHWFSFQVRNTGGSDANNIVFTVRVPNLFWNPSTIDYESPWGPNYLPYPAIFSALSEPGYQVYRFDLKGFALPRGYKWTFHIPLETPPVGGYPPFKLEATCQYGGISYTFKRDIYINVIDLEIVDYGTEVSGSDPYDVTVWAKVNVTYYDGVVKTAALTGDFSIGTSPPVFVYAGSNLWYNGGWGRDASFNAVQGRWEAVFTGIPAGSYDWSFYMGADTASVYEHDTVVVP